MRKELADKIAVILSPYLGQEDLQEVRLKLDMILEEFDVEKRKTELVVYEGNKNQMIVDRFIAAKIAAGRTRRTVMFYRNSIPKSLSEIGKNYDEVTPDDIRAWIAKRIYRDGVSKCTVDNEKRNLSSFYTWLQREEILLANPMNKIDAIKFTKTKKTAFSPMEIETMRTRLRSTRETALFELLLSTWARVSEVVGIKLSDINGDKILVHGKGEKDRYVYLNARAKVALDLYLKDRNDSNPYLFPKCKKAGDVKAFTKRGRGQMCEWYKDKKMVSDTEHMDAGTVETIIRNLGKRAEVQNAHPHRFRRTGATMALRAGMPLMQVSKSLGHNNISTTQIYLDISDEELMDAHKRYVS